jgi:hypothetical protein
VREEEEIYINEEIEARLDEESKRLLQEIRTPRENGHYGKTRADLGVYISPVLGLSGQTNGSGVKRLNALIALGLITLGGACISMGNAYCYRPTFLSDRE